MKKERFPIPPHVSFRSYAKSIMREEISILRQKFLWSQADRIISVSNAQKKELKNWYGIKQSKIRVVYNGVDHHIFKQEKSENLKKSLNIEGKKIILYVGHFGLRKGISFLLQAISTTIKEEKEAFLICVGGTPKWLGTDMYWNIYEEIIKKKSLSNHVKLLGEIPHHLLPAYYSLADVFAFPSLYEAQGKVILEAMACKVPVVTTKVGGIPEMVNNGVNGLLVPPKNSIELSQAIINLLQNNKLAK
jgi:glycosyltransferase involved in cell wall biosynthesis